MIKYYHQNGNIVSAKDANLKVSDLSILRGYGIFDFFLFQKGQPLFFDDYINRFFNSASRLRLELDLSKEALQSHVLELIQANGLQEGGIRLVLTGGYASDSYTPTKPNLLILQHPFAHQPKERYEKGVSLITFQHQRVLPEIKSTSYVTGIWLLDKIEAANADFVLYHDGTYVRESDRSNFFVVSKEGTLITPSDKILLGITRKQILEAVEGQIEVEERDLRLEELNNVEEAFFSSSIKGAMPVVQIDGNQIGEGVPGPITQKIMKLLKARKEAYLAEKAIKV